MQVKATVAAQQRRGPAQITLGDQAGWLSEDETVIRVDTTACLSADALVASIFRVCGCSTAELLDWSADVIRELVGGVLTIDGIDAVWKTTERTALCWSGMSDVERTHWAVCAAKVWEAFGLPGTAPTQPCPIDIRRSSAGFDFEPVAGVLASV